MMKRGIEAGRVLAYAVLALLAVASGPALTAQERIALIVTNQNYSLKELKLANTHADGELLKVALEAVGFKVWNARDTGSRSELEKVIGDHVARLANAGPNAIGFFYYSGHGAADGPRGRNYLIPTEVNINHTAQLRLSALSVEQIVDALAGAGGKMSFVVFDACRNVPLQSADKSTFKGFAPFREAPGLLIAYATEPGNVAVDENLYARALAEEIRQPGREAGSAFRAVSRRVYEATGQRQRPDIRDLRFDDFVFQPAAPQIAVGTFSERPAPVCDGVEVSLSPSGSQCIEPGSGKTSPVRENSNVLNSFQDKDSNCIVVDKSVGKPVAVKEGTIFCSKDGSRMAIIKNIGSYYMSFETFGGRSDSCRKTERCKFDWVDAPIFSIGMSSDSQGEKSAFILFR